VPTAAFAPAAEARILATAQKYLPGLPVRVERVSEIPVLPGGKRQVVVVER
jgi:hypothetical protein